MKGNYLRGMKRQNLFLSCTKDPIVKIDFVDDIAVTKIMFYLREQNFHLRNELTIISKKSYNISSHPDLKNFRTFSGHISLELRISTN